MLKYNKNDYDEGRERVKGDLAINFLKKALEKNDIKIEDNVCKRVFMDFASNLFFNLYEEPEKYLDMGKFVIYRSANLFNLLTIQAKSGENAKTILDYVAHGGVYSEELGNLVENFVRNLSEEAVREQQKTSQKVNELTQLSNKAKKMSKKRTKEK